MLTLCLCLPPSSLALPLPLVHSTISYIIAYAAVLQSYCSCWTGFQWICMAREGSSYSNSPCLWVSPLLLGLTRRPRSGSAGARGRQRDGGIGLQMVVTTLQLGSLGVCDRLWTLILGHRFCQWCSPEYRSLICQVHVGPENTDKMEAEEYTTGQKKSHY